MVFQLLTFLCFVGIAFAGPYKKDIGHQCTTSCPATSTQKFNYHSGNQYIYKYQSTDYITIAGTSKQQKSQLTANAKIHVLTKCEMTLQLTDVQYQGDQALSAELKDQLKIPLHFLWADGNIETICSRSEETQESENIKKSILSSIVNTMFDLQSPIQHREIDSLGSCETKYTIFKNNINSIIVKKEKYLKSCDNRHSGVTAFPYNSYKSSESKIQTLPIFTNEKFECQQVIENNIMKQVTCKSSAQIHPQRDNLIELQAEIQLVLQNVQKNSMMHQYSINQNSQIEKKSIRYSYKQIYDTKAKEKSANDILIEICSKSQGPLHQTVNKLYVRLIKELRGLPVENIQRIYESLKNQILCHSAKTLDIFLDALSMVGTEGSIKLMVNLLQNKQVSNLKAKIWAASFAMIPNPNDESISAVLPLIINEEKDRFILLGLSAMISKICSNRDCNTVKPVKFVVSALQEGLKPQCTSDNEENIVTILKAFGNMGYHGEAQETILACTQSKQQSQTVRLAAIDSFRRFSKKIPLKLIDIYSSTTDDYELRIAALATVIKNADQQTIDAIQNVLSNEENEQVVAYTISLVKNLQKTTSPLKQSLKQAVQQIHINRHISYWENSKNIEISTFKVSTNLGASLESNVIHDQNNKIPKYFTSKLDIDIFGKNVNVFEFGVRAQGLEKVIRKVLKMDKSTEHTKSWLPFNFNTKEDEEERKPEISFYTRTMGCEFFYETFSDFNIVSRMMQLANIVNKFSHNEKTDFAQSFLFLDSKIIIPSITGRSYIFGMTGSTTIGLSASGKFDIINLMSKPRNCDIQGHFQPSANVEITTTLGIYSQKYRPTIKIVTVFHSESDIGAKLQIKNGHMVETELNLPSENIQLLKINTELFEIDSNDDEKSILTNAQPKNNHCFNTLEKSLGIQLCGKFGGYGNFPYATEIGNVELSIKKVDKAMKGYFISFELPKYKSDQMSYKFVMDTPGSLIHRKFQANLDMKQLSSGEQEFKFDGQCPFKTISSNGFYFWKTNYAQSSFSVIIDKSHRYSMNATIEMKHSASEMIFKPTLQWIDPESKPISISGLVAYNNNRKQNITIDFRFNKSEIKQYIFKGNLIKDGQFGLMNNNQWRLSADLTAEIPFFPTKFHSTIIISRKSKEISSTFTVEYETQNSRKKSLTFSFKFQKFLNKISASAQFVTTKNSQFNWALNWDMQGHLKEAMENEIMLRYGQNPEQTYIQLLQISKIVGSNTSFDGKFTIKAPQFSIDTELKLSLGLQIKNKESFYIESDFHINKNRHIKCLIKLKQLSKKPVKIAVEAQVEYSGQKLIYKNEIEEISFNTFQGHSALHWHPNQQAYFQFKYKKLSNDFIFHHEIESVLNASFMHSQLQNQALVKLSNSAIEIQGEIRTNKESLYKINAQVQPKGLSEVQVSSPATDVEIQVNNKPVQKSGKAILIWKKNNTHRLTVSVSLNMNFRKSIQAEVSWDDDKNPLQKVSIATEYEINSQVNERSFVISSQFQVLDLISASVSCSGENGDSSTLQSNIEISGRNFEKIHLNTKAEINKQSIHSIISFQQAQQEKVVLELNGKKTKQTKTSEIQISASIKSPNNYFNDKELFYEHSYSRTHSSINLQCIIHFENTPGKKHELTVNYGYETKLSKKLRITIKTPYPHFRHQEINLSQRIEQSKQTINADISIGFRKTIVLASILSKTNHSASLACLLRTSHNAFQEVSVFTAYENKKNDKWAKSYFELNGQRKFEASGKYSSKYGQIRSHVNFKLFSKSEVAINIKAEKSLNSSNHELSLSKDSFKLISYKISHRVSDNEFYYLLEAKNNMKTILTIKLEIDKKGYVKYTLKINKNSTLIFITVHLPKNENYFRNIIINKNIESSNKQDCKIHRYYKEELLNEINKDTLNTPKKFVFEIKKETETGDIEEICSIHFLHSIVDCVIKSQFVLKVKRQKHEYEINVKEDNGKNFLELEANLISPSHPIQYNISAIDNIQRAIYKPAAVSSSKTKLYIQFIKISNDQYFGEFYLSHPALETPLKANYSITKEYSQWSNGKIELLYSKNPSNNVVIKILNQNSRRQSDKRILQLEAFTQSREMVFDLETSIYKTNRKDIITCEWKWIFKQNTRSGKLYIEKLYKISNEPHSILMQHTSPHSDYLLEGRCEWLTSKFPFKAEIKRSSHSQATGQISYHFSDSCTDFEIQSSVSLLKNRICINKKEQGGITVLNLETDCKGEKCLTVQIKLNPHQFYVANISVTWQKRQFQNLLKTLRRELSDVIQLSYINTTNDVIQKVERMCSPLKQVLQLLLADITEQILQFSKEQTKVLGKLDQHFRIFFKKLDTFPTFKELKQQLDNVAKFIQEDIIKYLKRNIPEKLINFMKVATNLAKLSFNKIYAAKTFCIQMQNAYQQNSFVQQVKQFLKNESNRQIKNIQQIGTKIINNVQNLMKVVWKKYIELDNEWKGKIFSLIQSWKNFSVITKYLDSAKNVEEYIKSRTCDFLEKLMESLSILLNYANKNDNFKVLSSSFNKFLKNIGNIDLKDSLEALGKIFAHKTPKTWLRKKINFTEFNIQTGNIRIQIYQPFD